jgi:hypothetical protein
MESGRRLVIVVVTRLLVIIIIIMILPCTFVVVLQHQLTPIILVRIHELILAFPKLLHLQFQHGVNGCQLPLQQVLSWRRVSTTGLVVTLDCLLVWLAKDCSDGDRLIVPTGNVADAVALLIVSPQLVGGRMVGNVLLIAGVDV